jgi:hypothetical protein
MSGTSLLAEIEAAISKPDASRALKGYADVYFEELLEQDGLPEEYFSVVAASLTRPSLFRVRGAEMFLYQTYASIDAVSESQKEQLLAIIQDRFGEYENDALCYVAADFIARVYPTRIALEAASGLLDNSSSPQQFAGVQMMIDIISKSSSAEEFVPELNRLQETLSARNPG